MATHVLEDPNAGLETQDDLAQIDEPEALERERRTQSEYQNMSVWKSDPWRLKRVRNRQRLKAR